MELVLQLAFLDGELHYLGSSLLHPSLQLVVRLLELRLQIPQGEVSFNASQNLLKLKWFRNVIPPADGKGFDLVCCFIQGADKDYGNVASIFIRSQMLADLKAIHPWHIYIEQDQIRRGRPRGHKGHVPVDCGANFESLPG
jgi:hypothetical protein